MNNTLLLRSGFPSPTILCNNIRWTLSGMGQHYLNAETLDLDALRSSTNTTIIKHGQHRTVYKVDLPTATIYIKHCRIWNTRAWLREWLRPPKAKMEFDRALQLTARGFHTFEPLAWGVVKDWFPKGSFLITLELPQTAPLDRFLEARVGARNQFHQVDQRQRLAQELGIYLAQLHNAGIAHPDFHPGNLLIATQTDGSAKFYLLDLHAIRLGQPLSRSERIENLAMFNRWFQQRASRTDRFRFWQAYQQHSDSIGQLINNRDVEQATQQSNHRFWYSREARYVNRNRSFTLVSSSTCRGYAVADLDAEFLQGLLANPDAPFASALHPKRKDSRSSTVIELPMPTKHGTKEMIYKRFRITKWYDPIINLLRRSPTLRSWIWGHSFLDRMLPTPRPWLMFHRLQTGMPAEGYLLCEKVPEAVELQQAFQTICSLAEPKRHHVKWQLLDKLARLIRQMHERGLSHRDLKAANVLLAGSLESEYELMFIDLVGVQRCSPQSTKQPLQNLVRLHASFWDHPGLTKSDRLRFLRCYFNWGLKGKQKWKTWWKNIALGTEAKKRKNAKQGRPLV